jgi:transposase
VWLKLPLQKGLPLMGKKTVSHEKKIVVKSLVDSGMPYRKVKEVTGVSLGFICRIVKQFEADRGLIDWYQKNKVELLQKAQAENLALQQAIRDSLTEDEIKKFAPDQKARWFAALGVDHGIKFDKERLQSDMSTENISIIVKHMRQLKEAEADEDE